MSPDLVGVSITSRLKGVPHTRLPPLHSRSLLPYLRGPRHDRLASFSRRQTDTGLGQAYTAGLPTRVRTERKAEIASDLWEHATEGGIEGESTHSIAAHIFGRTVLGVPADVSWHISELKGENMQFSTSQRAIVGAFIALGVATVVFAVLIFINGIADEWLFTDARDTVEGLLLLTFTTGPFIAIAGVYAWRRADSEGSNTNGARSMIVAGTLCMAGLAGWMYWTIIGPVIAVSVVAYWAYKIGQWRSETPTQT